MALKATVFKAEVEVADVDRGHYGTYALTIARHPSETDVRMMVRVLAFALNATERLEFTRGLCVDDEPDLWERDLTGAITTWIELGQPDEKRLRKAASRASRVVVYGYGGQATRAWWASQKTALARVRGLEVYDVPREVAERLGALAERDMRLSCTVQEGGVFFGTAGETLQFELERLT
ncbi:MAG: YaeQ family protein [Myxococcales bacterium]|nr:YaeQ family protein [Myxococcales bacterium]